MTDANWMEYAPETNQEAFGVYNYEPPAWYEAEDDPYNDLFDGYEDWERQHDTRQEERGER
jgi:hypothetical protein